MTVLDDIRAKGDEVTKHVDFILMLERAARNPNWALADPGYTNMRAVASTAADALIVSAQEMKALIG